MITWLKDIFRKPEPCNHGWWRDARNILWTETKCPDCGWHDRGFVMESHDAPDPGPSLPLSAGRPT